MNLRFKAALLSIVSISILLGIITFCTRPSDDFTEITNAIITGPDDIPLSDCNLNKEALSYTDITEIEFSWQTIAGADGYEIFINEYRFPDQTYISDIESIKADFIQGSSWTPEETYKGLLPCSPNPYRWRVRAVNDFQFYWSDTSCFYINDGDYPKVTISIPNYEDTANPTTCLSDSHDGDNCSTLAPKAHMWHPLSFDLLIEDTTGIISADVSITNNTTGDVVDPITVFDSTKEGGPNFTLPVTLADKLAHGCDQTFTFTFNDCGNNTETMTLPVYLHPITPVLITPLDGHALCTTSPTFQWRQSIGAEGYEIEIYKGESVSGTPDFTYEVESTSENIDPGIDVAESYTMLEKLDKETFYTWRVRAKDTSCDSLDLYSQWASATFEVLGDTVPQQVEPSAGTCVLITPEKYTWTTIGGASEYILKFYKQPPMLDHAFDEGSAGTEPSEDKDNWGEYAIDPIVLEPCPADDDDNPCDASNVPLNNKYTYRPSSSVINKLRGYTVYWTVSSVVGDAGVCADLKARPRELTLYDWYCDEDVVSQTIDANPCGLAIYDEYVFVTTEKLQDFHIEAWEPEGLDLISRSKSTTIWRNSGGELSDIAYDKNTGLVYVTWSTCVRGDSCDEQRGGVTIFQFDELSDQFEYVTNLSLSNATFEDIGVVRPGGLWLYDGIPTWSDQPGTGEDSICDAHQMDFEYIDPTDITWERGITYDTQDTGAHYTVASFDLIADPDYNIVFVPTVGLNCGGLGSCSPESGACSFNVFERDTGNYLYSIADGECKNPTGMAVAEFCGNKYLLWFDIGIDAGDVPKLVVWKYFDPDNPQLKPGTTDEYDYAIYIGEVEGECFFYNPYNIAIYPETKDLYYTDLQHGEFKPGFLKYMELLPSWDSDNNDHSNNIDNNNPHTFDCEPNYDDEK